MVVNGRTKQVVCFNAISALVARLIRDLDIPQGSRARGAGRGAKRLRRAPSMCAGRELWDLEGCARGSFRCACGGRLFLEVGAKLACRGAKSDKNKSRKLAALLFPQASDQLARVMDQGRAKSLLIAAHGQWVDREGKGSDYLSTIVRLRIAHWELANAVERLVIDPGPVIETGAQRKRRRKEGWDLKSQFV